MSDGFESDDDDLKSTKKHGQVKKLRLTSLPTKAEASPPTIKRSRSEMEDEEDTDIEVRTYHRQTNVGGQTPAVPGGRLSDLHKRFCVAKKEPMVAPKTEDYELGIHDHHHGPYYL